MTISPMAIGILVVPREKWLIRVPIEGNRKLKITPIAMAKNIHNVKNLSKNDNCFILFIGKCPF